MPWTTRDVSKHNKGLSAAQKTRWVEVANSTLAACEEDDGGDCEAKAIRAANAAVSEMSEIREMGATSFAALKAQRAAEEKARTMFQTVRDYTDLIWNIIYSVEIEDKAAALAALTTEFIQVLGQAANEDDVTEEEPEAELEEQDGEEPPAVEDDGRWRFEDDEQQVATFVPTRRI